MEMWSNSVIGRIALGVSVGVMVSGCTRQAEQSGPPPVPPPVVSFDGRYEATMRVTGASGATPISQCATSSRSSIDVRNGQFSLAVPHPGVATATPSLASRTTPIYNATIRQDGGITGTSNDTNTTMEGRVSGNRMSGQIYGLLCYYEFSADRV
jgi:hypothetical protein